MIVLILLMVLVASYESVRRQTLKIPNFFLISVASIIFSLVLVLTPILTVILDVRPWFNPYIMIPIAGMIIGNSLNSLSIAIHRFAGELNHRKLEVETFLSLGAPPRDAVQNAFNESVRAALIPSINSLMTVGLVQIPGVMVGQILAGASPITAIRYQIIIMYLWIASATISNIVGTLMVYRQYFTARAQLKTELLENK
jgi:putative ABC transport system permease protein